MAACRAIMKGDYKITPIDANDFRWDINFMCEILDGSGGYFDIDTHTVVANGDSAATTMTKIVDNVVAGITARGDGSTILRTSVYLVDFLRGS